MNIKKASCIALLVVITTLLIYYKLDSCGSCLSKQDIEFVEKVSKSITKETALIKARNIQEGNWKKVCVFPGGHDLNLLEAIKSQEFSAKNLRITNNSYPYISEKYDESALVFYRDSSEKDFGDIEIYRITPDIAWYAGKDCLDIDLAYFRIKKFEKNNTPTQIYLISEKGE